MAQTLYTKKKKKNITLNFGHLRKSLLTSETFAAPLAMVALEYVRQY